MNEWQYNFNTAYLTPENRSNNCFLVLLRIYCPGAALKDHSSHMNWSETETQIRKRFYKKKLNLGLQSPAPEVGHAVLGPIDDIGYHNDGPGNRGADEY